MKQRWHIGLFSLSLLLSFCVPPEASGGVPVSSPPTVPLIELRQYTLKPGKRDTLIDLFEREFVESQEALGMRIVGTFRDLERPDRFVWIRGFKDMPSRAEELNAFYSGPVWKANREAANATMIDTDDVLLLREARAGSGFRSGGSRRERRAASKGLVIATIYPFATAVDQDFLDFFASRVVPELKTAGVDLRAYYLTETSPNNFPRLPVREGENVFVWFAAFPESAAYDRALVSLGKSAGWQAITKQLKQHLKGDPLVLRLQPTPRSGFRP